MKFGAGFRIGEAKTRYGEGNVSSSFQIVINDVPVERLNSVILILRSGERAFETFCARATAALALAFFIAQLENDPKLSNTVALFDDPFTSQDETRAYTAPDKVSSQVVSPSNRALPTIQLS